MTALNICLLFLGCAVCLGLGYLCRFLISDLLAEMDDHDSPDAGTRERDQRNFKH